jgi:hypothetical protein
MPRTLFETPLAPAADNPAPRPRRDAPPPDRLRTVVEAAVSVVFSVDTAHLHAGSRGQAQVAHARQVAMYLMHCAFSLSHTEIGRAFGRDRTTVGHACAIVEDRRDAPVYDRTLTHLEEIVRRLATVSIHHEGF